jgi:hypothetical protein
MNQRRRTPVNCRLSVESAQMTSKLRGYVTSGLVCPIPAYGTGGVRHRGSVSLVRGSYVELREPSAAMPRERHKRKL